MLNPEFIDHYLVYRIMKAVVSQHQRKKVTFRSTKPLDADKFNEELACAP